MADRIKLSARHIVVGEGAADCAFLWALTCQRGLEDFQVIAPGEVIQGAGGRAAFTHVLNYLPMLPGFDRVEAILLISDNDDAPDRSFREVVQAVQGAEEFGSRLASIQFLPIRERRQQGPARPSLCTWSPDPTSRAIWRPGASPRPNRVILF